jgi:hypothetical protein
MASPLYVDRWFRLIKTSDPRGRSQDELAARMRQNTVPHPQTQSPLFNRIPGEIRDLILEFAVTATDIYSAPVPDDDPCFRPGYRFRKRIFLDVLLTCRKIYLEARLFPASVNEHVFWGYRGPAYRSHWDTAGQYFRKMSQEKRSVVEVVHFFTQQFFLEHLDLPLVPYRLVSPRKCMITLRHEDWWMWENGEPLGIHPFRPGRVMHNEMDLPPSGIGWGNTFRNMRGLKEIEIEFETVATKKKELDGIVQRALRWKFPNGDGMCLIAAANRVQRSEWKGVEKDTVDVYNNRPRLLDNELVIDWSVTRQQAEELQASRLATGSRDLNSYYVVSVTWRPE